MSLARASTKDMQPLVVSKANFVFYHNKEDKIKDHYAIGKTLG